MYVKVNGTRLFFDVVGSGLQPVGQEMKPKPVVIALHGGPGYDHSYLRSLDPLSEVAQVIYLDLRGQGRSARHHSEYYQLGIMADDVAALCAEFDLEKPVVLGHSFGGWVALTLAVRYPELPGGLLLCSTSPRGTDYLDLDLVEQLVGKELREIAARNAVGQASEEDMQRFGKALFPIFNDPPKPELLATIFSRMILNREIIAYMEERLRNEYDVRPQLTSIMVPTLVLHGRYDWVTSLRGAEEIAHNIPHARLHVFERAGHILPAEVPEEVIQVVRTFLVTSLQNELPLPSSE
jgi:proline iminopeptidase